jgi:hypothetical protein
VLQRANGTAVLICLPIVLLVGATIEVVGVDDPTVAAVLWLLGAALALTVLSLLRRA